jgi:hypothetical protein
MGSILGKDARALLAATFAGGGGSSGPAVRPLGDDASYAAGKTLPVKNETASPILDG